MKKKLTILMIAMILSLSGCAKMPEENEMIKNSYGMNDLTITEDLTMDDLFIMNDGNIDIHYFSGTGIPKEINGRFSSIRIFDEKDAITSIFSLRSILQMPNDVEFYCSSIDKDRNEINAFFIVQVYRNIPVEDAKIEVYAKKDGTPIGLRGRCFSITNISTTPQVSAEKGIQSVKMNPKMIVSNVSLVIIMKDDTPVLCWKYEIESSDLSSCKNSYVDANSGALVKENSTAISLT